MDANGDPIARAAARVSAPVAGIGGTVIAALGILGGIAADYGKSRAGEHYVELTKATGAHITAMGEQVDELQADKAYLMTLVERLRAERAELRHELEHAERLLQLERGARLNPSGIAAPANPPPP